MPLPWLMVFLSIFFCAYSVFLFVYYHPYFNSTYCVNLKPNPSVLPW